MRKVLCTGGAGYIGIHAVCRLIETGYECVVVDNLSNPSTSFASVARLSKLLKKDISYHNIDVCDYKKMTDLFSNQKFDIVVHYAALKAVGESVENPIEYYENNVNCVITLLKAMRDHGVHNFVFSSSCTVYLPQETPLNEDSPIGASNPYGQTKVMCEQILRDACVADKKLRVSLLRYFNPVGAHESGQLGESADNPLNLLPYIQQVAIGRREALSVFGNDWPTRDGTGIRDYIHVMDLADGHIAAMENLEKLPGGKCVAYNLGTGQGTSVLELVKAFEEATGTKISFKFQGRRAGDIAYAVCDTKKANEVLGWKCSRTIQDACKSAHHWQTLNPQGYPKNA